MEISVPDEETRVLSPECPRAMPSSNISDEEVNISSERSPIVSSEKSTSPEKVSNVGSLESSSSINEPISPIEANLNEENSNTNDISADFIPNEPVIKETGDSDKMEDTDESTKETVNNQSDDTMEDSINSSRVNVDSEMHDCSIDTTAETVVLNNESFIKNSVDTRHTDFESDSLPEQSKKCEIDLLEQSQNTSSLEMDCSSDNNVENGLSKDSDLSELDQLKDKNNCDYINSSTTEQSCIDYEECNNAVKSLVDSLCDHVDENNLLNNISETTVCAESDSNDDPPKNSSENKVDSNIQEVVNSSASALEDSYPTIDTNAYSSCDSIPSKQSQGDNIVPQLPPTPQTPASNHSQQHSFHGDECHSSGEDFSNNENIPSPINKRNICQLKSNNTTFDRYNDDDEMHQDYRTSPQMDQEVEGNCYTHSTSSLPTPNLLRKNTPTPDMAHLGVYTPDSSTNSGYNSVDVDVNHLNLESPSSINSNELPQQNSIEPSPQASTPQSYTDQLSVQGSGSYCSSEKETNRTVITSVTSEQMHKNSVCTPAVTHSNISSQMHLSQPQQHPLSHQQPVTTYPQHPASAALSSMVSNNSVGTLLLGPTTPVAPSNNYAINIGMPTSHPSTNSNVDGYVLGLSPVIQPQPASMSHHHSHLQNTNQTSHGSMQRLSHISMPVATSSCAVSSHTFHLQSPSYTYSNAPAPNQSTSCSITKLQQLTNGIDDLPQNNQIAYAPMSSSYNSPSHQSNLAPLSQVQRPIAPAILNLQSQSSLPTNQVHGYTTNYNHRFHHRPVQRTPNIGNIPSIGISYQPVGYRMQQASPLGGGALINTGYINAGFIAPPSSPMQMGVVNMHAQGQYQETMQQVRPQNTMYTNYCLSSQPLNTMMRR